MSSTFLLDDTIQLQLSRAEYFELTIMIIVAEQRFHNQRVSRTDHQAKTRDLGLKKTKDVVRIDQHASEKVG
ncbi:unnamed protein product [Strongylus vulgaris]|uniref:Uncharacterized protein n=1 Tax=Strongylus vulgaris TaxID=40348 RepID=A0A3P7K8F3_STRVU|nr:unnamed protein product [Strongylus vulgaris]